MVYCGKPSKACEECRLRRTKCDTKKPSCSQCVRAGRACKGYRDPGELIFRDESQTLSAKRQRIKESHTQTSAQSNNMGSTSPSASAAFSADKLDWALLPISPAPVSNITLAPSADDQATCFFFQNYVPANDLFGNRGTFQFLMDVYGCEEIGSALADSVASLGMVGLASFWKAPSIIYNARIKYVSALKTLASHLRNKEEAKTDQTLIATMLLSLYETNVCKGRQSMDTAMHHIKGATALLQLRGKEQLRTPVGYHIFVYLRTQAITSCILRKATVPPVISEWNKELDFEDIDKAAATTLSEIAIGYCNLRASMASFDDFVDAERIISEACKLDEEFDLWAKTCPMQYLYQTVTLKEKHYEVFSDHYHAYSSTWIATLWNHYRCIRTLVNELILHQLSHLRKNSPEKSILWQDPHFFETQLSTSKTTLLQLCHDICASAPYFLNFNSDAGPERELPKAVNGNLLLWPLYSAGCTEIVSSIMRTWVAERLQWIADVMGIRQAAALAFTVTRQQDLLSWQGEVEDLASGSYKNSLLGSVAVVMPKKNEVEHGKQVAN